MKVCVICFDFKESNIRRQPWRYIYELCKGIISQNIDLKLISDGGQKSEEDDLISGIKILRIKKLRSIFFGETKELSKALKKENPDTVITLTGLTTFLSLRFKVDFPMIGILTSPIYSLRDLKRLGLREIVCNFNYIFIHLIGAITPRSLIRKRINSLNYMVVLSEANRSKLKCFGVDPKKIVLIPPGIGEFDLISPDEKNVENLRREINPENGLTIIYFGPSLTLRGTDTLIEAFVRVKNAIPSCKLLILSRLAQNELLDQEDHIKAISEKKGVSDSVNIVSGVLKPEAVKEYISAADLVTLPFKIVISDVPMSILEAMALGKPVISTNIDGISELLDGHGVVVEPNDSRQLSDAIITLLSDPELALGIERRARDYMMTHHRWKETAGRFVELIQ
ncbi:MAG: glycosyltransferase family 4 protein [Halobacteriota archaeon]|nr:glycosyltransferase family 4 protein [Halobacteriota archaeon]